MGILSENAEPEAHISAKLPDTETWPCDVQQLRECGVNVRCEVWVTCSGSGVVDGQREGMRRGSL